MFDELKEDATIMAEELGHEFTTVAHLAYALLHRYPELEKQTMVSADEVLAAIITLSQGVPPKSEKFRNIDPYYVSKAMARVKSSAGYDDLLDIEDKIGVNTTPQQLVRVIAVYGGYVGLTLFHLFRMRI